MRKLRFRCGQFFFCFFGDEALQISFHDASYFATRVGGPWQIARVEHLLAHRKGLARGPAVHVF